MEGLDILKKDWQQRGDNQPKLSYNQIYNMLYKKSTSIVKWIFIISIVELLFWTSFLFITPKSTYEIMDAIGATTFMIVFHIIHYIVFITFIVIFVKNYYSIKVTDNTRQLMDSILKTRKTVKYFVIYNVVAFALAMICINVFYYYNSDALLLIIQESIGVIDNKKQFLKVFFIMQIVVSAIMLGFLLLFYRIVYGILLKRLRKNYKELEKIEV